MYGYRRDTTPSLRAFAEQGARFDAAYAPAPATGPSHATLFTGLFPIGHGVVKNGLLMRWPGHIAPGGVLGTPTSLVDVLPTLLDLLGLPADPTLQGRSRAPALTGPAALPDPERPIFLQRRPFPRTRIAGFDVAGEGFAIRAGRWKYIEAPDEGRRELYDLTSDPGEHRDILATNRAVADEPSARLRDWRRRDASPASRGVVSEGDRARLRAMGYAE